MLSSQDSSVESVSVKKLVTIISRGISGREDTYDMNDVCLDYYSNENQVE
jgi:hypothetical protein